MQGPVRQRKGFAMGQKTPGYGEYSDSPAGRPTGYARGGSVKTAGMHSMHGGLKKSGFTSTHKSHGHGLGVQHQDTGGVGEGGATKGGSQSGSKGPSNTQFGSGMPGGKGSSLGRW